MVKFASQHNNIFGAANRNKTYHYPCSEFLNCSSDKKAHNFMQMLKTYKQYSWIELCTFKESPIPLSGGNFISFQLGFVSKWSPFLFQQNLKQRKPISILLPPVNGDWSHNIESLKFILSLQNMTWKVQGEDEMKCVKSVNQSCRGKENMHSRKGYGLKS